MSGLDRPSILAAVGAGASFGLDHRPADAEGGATGLEVKLLCMYPLVEPELMVRRMLPNELFQFLYGSPIVKGDSMGLLFPDDPVKRRLDSMDGLDRTVGDLFCDGVCGFEGSAPGLRWSIEASSFISYVSAIPVSATDDRRP
jgi:hypothetical protein